MINAIVVGLDRFFKRNLFERLIVYLMLSAFLVKVIFEFGLGQSSFGQSQNRQWFFYGFLVLDYLFSIRKTINIQVTLNPMSVLAIIFLIMCAHGLFLGLTYGNAPFVILNDFVPLFMIALNILRMQSKAEYRPVDIHWLLKTCTIVALGTCLFGLAAELVGKPSQPSLGVGAIMLPLFFASLFTLRPYPKWIAIAFVIMVVLTIEDFNRTNLAFCGMVLGGFVFIKLIKTPLYGIASAIIVIMVATAGWAILPETSRAYQRIVGLTNINLESRQGSIGERQAEQDAIRAILIKNGETVRWLGRGFGGLYEVQFTYEYHEDYGHAHYSWAWFNLRFGLSGYIYLVLFLSALAYNFSKGLQRPISDTGLFVSFMCLMGLIFCVTHVNSVLLLSGLHFFYLGHIARAREKQT